MADTIDPAVGIRRLGKPLVIWDRSSSPASKSVTTWNHRKGFRSLLSVAEEDRDLLTNKIFGWFADLHQHLVLRVESNPTASAHCYEAIRSSLVARRNPWLIPHFGTLVRIAVVDSILEKERPVALHYEGDDRFHSLLLSTCAKIHQIPFRQTSEISKVKSLRVPIWRGKGLSHSEFLRLIVFLARRRGLRRLKTNLPAKNSVLLVAPLAHVDQNALANGRFRSNFWHHLPQRLADFGVEVTMVHWISKNSTFRPRRIPDQVIKSSRSLILDSYLDPRGVRTALSAWKKSQRALREEWQSVVSSDSIPVPRYFLICIDEPLRRSLYGDLALEAALQREVVRKFATEVPHLHRLVIASENFSVEADFLEFFGSKVAEDSILFAHAGVRPWDLRYGRLTTTHGGPASSLSAMDRKALIAIGGSVDRRYLVTYPESSSLVTEVEALRFMPEEYSASSPHAGFGGADPRRLLVLGDYERRATESTCALIQEVLDSGQGRFKVVFRPHPLTGTRDNHLLIDAEISSASRIQDDVERSDLVVSPASTSSVLAVAITGKPIGAIIDCEDLNFAPDFPGVFYIRDRSDLERFLNGVDLGVGYGVHDQLNLEPTLPRWCSLLAPPLD